MTLSLDPALIITLSAAFVLGVEHAFEPDHVVAVSTIVTQSKGLTRSLLSGSFWGLGHTVTLLTVGLLFILLRVQLPAKVSIAFELFVGIMLILLGIWTLGNVKRKKMHFHVHSHEGKAHAHLHSHMGRASHEHAHVPFSVGIVHGLAGSGALAILAVSTMPDFSHVILFITAFGGGSITGMSMISSALSLPFILGRRLSPRIAPFLSGGAGLLSTALGILAILHSTP